MLFVATFVFGLHEGPLSGLLAVREDNLQSSLFDCSKSA